MISNWLKDNSHIAAWLGALTSVLTLGVAWRALLSWRNQKEYELVIENLANANFAREYIKGLRLLFYDDIKGTEEELTEVKQKEFKDSYSKTLAERMAVIQIRKDRNQKLREKFSYLKERNSVYGIDNDFYLFYKRIEEIDFEVSNTARYLFDLTLNEHGEQRRDRSDDDKLRAIIHYRQNDDITNEIDGMIKGFQKYRLKNRHF